MIGSPHPGDRVGPYRIDSLVTSGGMASVFRGTDIRTDHPVAIKIPHPQMEADVLFFDRFHREAEIGRKLDHPGVVKVLPDEDSGRVCMVMEWVEGRTLREILDEEKNSRPRGRAASCSASAMRSATFTVTASFIAISSRTTSWSMARIASNSSTSESQGRAGARRLTFSKFTKAMGTPDYVSPEQVNGKRGDARSDIYSLGAILYEMLTGEVPFQADNPLTALNQRLHNAPPSPRDIDPEISPQMEEIIHRALEREPEHRYASAHELAWDLEHPDQIGIEERREWRNTRAARVPSKSFNWSYVALALIPIVIFALLLIFARQQ